MSKPTLAAKIERLRGRKRAPQWEDDGDTVDLHDNEERYGLTGIASCRFCRQTIVQPWHGYPRHFMTGLLCVDIRHTRCPQAALYAAGSCGND